MQEESFAKQQERLDQIRAIKANDAKALERLYRLNYPKVESFVLKNNGSGEDAKDVFQEAFIATWRNVQLDKFALIPGASLEAYLLRLAKNKWLDHLRSANYKKTVPMAEENVENISIQEPPEAEKKYLEAVKANLKNIGNNCREVLTRFYYKKESLRQIAEAFEWTEPTARNNKYRCIERLRALMKNAKQ